jgi:hypothetical protein
MTDHTDHKRKLGRMLAAAAAIAASLAAAPASATRSDAVDSVDNLRLSVVGLTADQRLVKFRVVVPKITREIGRVVGFQGTDTALVGIDFRVQDGKLYGLGNAGGIYTIDTYSAALSQVSKLTVPLNGTSFGIDFNPAANALRIISDTGQNLRHPFAGPLMFQTQTDDPLDYPPATPLNTVGPTAPGNTGTAYTNNDLDAGTNTTMFNIDTVRNQVAVQSAPNNGSLVPTGSLTVDPGTTVGFDIYTKVEGGVAVRNSGFAALTVSDVSGFYGVNLFTGKATLVDEFKEPIVDIAIPLNQ